MHACVVCNGALNEIKYTATMHHIIFRKQGALITIFAYVIGECISFIYFLLLFYT